jgi:site-specific DNA recombinase
MKKLAAAPDADRLAALHDQIRGAETKVTGVRERLQAHEQQHGEAEQVRAALSAFGPAWDQLAPNEQARVIQLLVERVDFDGGAGTVSVTFHPGGIKALASEQGHEVAA